MVKQAALEEGMISLREAETLTGKSRRWLLDLIWNDRLPAARAGNIFLVRPADLEFVKDLKRGRPKLSATIRTEVRQATKAHKTPRKHR
jgi:hypothetical protein